MSGEWFPARVGRYGRVVHDARPFNVAPLRTRCGVYGGPDEMGGFNWIARCDLEPVTCKRCLKGRAA